MSDVVSVAGRLLEHCLGSNCPLQHLLNTGSFSDGWVSEYLELIKLAERDYGTNSLWPRELVAAAYTASVYCDKRYRDWQRLGGTANAETEAALQQIRWRGDSLLTGWFWREQA